MCESADAFILLVDVPSLASQDLSLSRSGSLTRVRGSRSPPAPHKSIEVRTSVEGPADGNPRSHSHPNSVPTLTFTLTISDVRKTSPIPLPLTLAPDARGRECRPAVRHIRTLLACARPLSEAMERGEADGWSAAALLRGRRRRELVTVQLPWQLCENRQSWHAAALLTRPAMSDERTCSPYSCTQSTYYSGVCRNSQCHMILDCRVCILYWY